MSRKRRKEPRGLKKLRLRAGLTQEELADAIGVGHSTISRYEGQGALPTLDKAFLLAQTLGVTLDLLSEELGVEVPENILSPTAVPNQDLISSLKLIEQAAAKLGRALQPEQQKTSKVGFEENKERNNTRKSNTGKTLH